MTWLRFQIILFPVDYLRDDVCRCVIKKCVIGNDLIIQSRWNRWSKWKILEKTMRRYDNRSFVTYVECGICTLEKMHNRSRWKWFSIFSLWKQRKQYNWKMIDEYYNFRVMFICYWYTCHCSLQQLFQTNKISSHNNNYRLHCVVVIDESHVGHRVFWFRYTSNILLNLSLDFVPSPNDLLTIFPRCERRGENDGARNIVNRH